MKKVLVTGINGLIGQYITQPLVDLGFEVFGIGRTESFQKNYFQVNLNNYNELEKIFCKIKPEYIIHLAWNLNDLNSNVHFDLLISSLKLLDIFSRNGGKKAIFAGTCYEYKPKKYRLKEIDEINTNTIYSKCKNYLREISELYSLKNCISFCWARIFNVYGKYYNINGLFPYIVNNLKENKKVIIEQPESERDYMFAGDIANALVSILISNVDGIINICSGQGIKLKNLALKVARVLDKTTLINLISLENYNPSIIVGDNSRLINEVGFREYSDIDKIIESLILECK